MTLRQTPPWLSTPLTGLLLVLILAVFALGPLLQPGYFWGAHDAKNSIYFLYEFDKSIQDGILWPRWGPDWGFGYGYPFWNIYGPLGYYVGETFLLAGFDHEAAVKLVFALSILCSAASMYLFVRRLLGSAAGVIASLVYVYAPYHMFDIYVRAALAESFAFVFVPLVLWSFFELVERPRPVAVVAAALAYAALMLTSNVLLLLITPLLALLVAALLLMRLRDNRRSGSGGGAREAVNQMVRPGIAAALGLILGLGLLAAFLLPALIERRYVRLDQWFGGRYEFGHDFVYPFQLFSPAWGFGASVAGPDDNTGFQLGLVPLVLFCLSFLSVPLIKQTGARHLMRFWQALTVLAVFMMTPASTLVWHLVPTLTAVQFPWRMGVLTSTGLAILAGSVVALPNDASQRNGVRAPSQQAGLPLVILCALIIIGANPYLQAEVRDPRPDEGPVSLAALFRYQQASDEMTGTTAWARRIPSWSSLAEEVVQGGTIDTRVNYAALPGDQTMGVHSVEADSVHELLWVYAADDQQSVTFFTGYYPGWTAHVYEDRKEPHDDLRARVGRLVATPAIRTTPQEGWIVVPVPSGEHFVELRFEDTPVRVVGQAISSVTLVGMLAGLLLALVRARRKGVARISREA